MKKVFLLSKYDISDTCVYLGSILKHYGTSVAILDETEESYIKYFLNAEEENMDIYEHQGIDYVFSKSRLEEISVEVVIVNTNKRMILPMIEQDDEVFVFVNQDRRLLLKTKSYLEALAARGFKNITRVMNMVDSKIEVEYISNMLEMENINILEDLEIYHDESNLSAKIENAYNSKVRFKGISKEYKDVLRLISQLIIGSEIEDKQSMKQFKKAFKLAERGGKNAGLFSK